MVMAVLVGLMALAAPFVFSMILHGRSARNNLNAEQARAGAEAAVAHGIAHLHNLVKKPGYDPTPDVDTLDELNVNMVIPGVEIDVKNPHGLMWSTSIEDEQAKVNLHTAPPTLLGNLLGSTLLAESVQKGGAVLIVNDATVFHTDDNEETIDGWVTVGTDTVPYFHIHGNEIHLAPNDTFNISHTHRIGALVADGRGRWIADYSEGRDGKTYRPFRSIYEIKAIADGRPYLAIRPDEFAAIERHITVHSRMGSPSWGRGEHLFGQTIRATQRSFRVENGEGFGVGARLRFIRGGKVFRYNVVESVRPVTGGRRQGKESWIVRTVDELGVDVQADKDNRIYVEPMLRHPINLNTAKYKVLVACFMGLSPYATSEAVNRKTAELLAQYIISPPGRAKGGSFAYANADDLKAVLDEAVARGILTPNLRDAVYINATEPNSPKLRTATVPFSFRSYGAYTVEGSGVVNGGNGFQLARHTLRQTVTLPSPPPGRFVLRTQEDFQHLVEQGQAARTVTWPVAMGPNTNLYRRSGFIKEADPKRGDIRLDVGQVADATKGQFVDHCDDPSNKAYFQEGYDFTRHGPWTFPGVRSGRGRNSSMASGSVELWYKPFGGGQAYFFDSGDEIDRNRVSFFYEPSRGLVIRIFDGNLEGKSVEYVYPATLDARTWYHIAGSWKSSHYNGQEVRVDGQLVPKEGKIQFKPGSKLTAEIDDEETDTLEVEDASDFPEAGAVRVGEEVIEYQSRAGGSLTQLRRGTRLSAATSHAEGEFVMPYGYSCRLGDTLLVGGARLAAEIAEPTSKNGGGMRISTRINNPGSIPKLPQGNDPVSVRIRSLFRNGFVLHSETKLPVEDASEFPPSGLVLVNGEAIHYTSRSATSLNGLNRAQAFGGRTGAARNLRGNATVTLVSFQVDKTGDYPRSGYVQIDKEDSDLEVEWLEYGEITSFENKHYFIARRTGGDPPVTIYTGSEFTEVQNQRTVGGAQNMRAHFGTAASAHEKKAKVIPVIEMNGSDGPIIGDQNSPRGDGISTVSLLTDGQKDGDVRWIKRSHVNQYLYSPRGVPVDYHYTIRMGLNDFVSRTFSKGQSRFLKFPAGEMPLEAPPRKVGVAMDGGGEMVGFVDELKVQALNSGGAKIALTAQDGKVFSSGDTSVLVEVTHAVPRDNGRGGASIDYKPDWPKSGMIRIGDELIFYERGTSSKTSYFSDIRPYIDNSKFQKQSKAQRAHPFNRMGKTVMQLSGLKRGVLGTEATDHPTGAGVMLYDAAPISMLNSAMSPLSDSFSILDGTGFPKEGYVWINDEVLSYRQGGGRSFSGCEPFRGCFGTSPSGHGAGSIVQSLPFRYWDRDARGYDGVGLAYLQAGYSSYDAIWDTVELKTNAGSERALPNTILPRVLVRFDRAPEWDTKPTNEEGGLFEFHGADVHILKGLIGGQGVRANEIEIRVYWNYKQGAFHPGQDWKKTFGLDELRATYHSPMDFRRLEQVERR